MFIRLFDNFEVQRRGQDDRFSKKSKTSETRSDCTKTTFLFLGASKEHFGRCGFSFFPLLVLCIEASRHVYCACQIMLARNFCRGVSTLRVAASRASAPRASFLGRSPAVLQPVWARGFGELNYAKDTKST
jgi:hypothetical protein